MTGSQARLTSEVRRPIDSQPNWLRASDDTNFLSVSHFDTSSLAHYDNSSSIDVDLFFLFHFARALIS